MKLKPSDPKFGTLLIALILAAVATLLFVLIPGSANLTVAYVFCLIGIVLMEGGFLLATTKNVPASYALIGQTGRFLPWSLVVSVIVLMLWLYLCSNVILLGAVLNSVLARRRKKRGKE